MVTRVTKTEDPSKEKSDSLATAEVAAIAAISTALGFPVPPVLARNILTATSSLVVAAVGVPTAWLESIAERIRATGKARAAVTMGAVPSVVESIDKDDELRARATTYLGGRMLREQKNRESVLQQAVDQLRTDAQGPASAPDDSPTPIDEDWLNIFGKLAEARSEETMQAYFARILAGEIRRPGSYAPGTLEVLSRMMKADAERFQQLLSLVTRFEVPGASAGQVQLNIHPCVLCAPYGAPGSNGLAELGFRYPVLCDLSDAGLIQHDFTAWRELHPSMFMVLRMRVGGTTFAFTPTRETDMAGRPQRSPCINLTRAGEELLRIAHLETNEAYAEKLASWIEKTFQVRRQSDDVPANK